VKCESEGRAFFILGSGQDGGKAVDPRTQFSIDDGKTWSTAWVVTPFPGWANPPISGTSWISVAANRVGPAKSRYRSQFNVVGQYIHEQSVDIRVHADNRAIVKLNGYIFGVQPAGSPAGNFRDPPEVLRTQNYMRVGSNDLEFFVDDAGRVTGLDYKAVVTYKTCSNPPPPPPPPGPIDPVPGPG
jgi:hypothetical protein